MQGDIVQGDIGGGGGDIVLEPDSLATVKLRTGRSSTFMHRLVANSAARTFQFIVWSYDFFSPQKSLSGSMNRQ